MLYGATKFTFFGDIISLHNESYSLHQVASLLEPALIDSITQFEAWKFFHYGNIYSCQLRQNFDNYTQKLSNFWQLTQLSYLVGKCVSFLMVNFPKKMLVDNYHKERTQKTHYGTVFFWFQNRPFLWERHGRVVSLSLFFPFRSVFWSQKKDSEGVFWWN